MRRPVSCERRSIARSVATRRETRPSRRGGSAAALLQRRSQATLVRRLSQTALLRRRSQATLVPNPVSRLSKGRAKMRPEPRSSIKYACRTHYPSGSVVHTASNHMHPAFHRIHAPWVAGLGSAAPVELRGVALLRERVRVLLRRRALLRRRDLVLHVRRLQGEAKRLQRPRGTRTQTIAEDLDCRLVG